MSLRQNGREGGTSGLRHAREEERFGASGHQPHTHTGSTVVTTGRYILARWVDKEGRTRACLQERNGKPDVNLTTPATQTRPKNVLLLAATSVKDWYVSKIKSVWIRETHGPTGLEKRHRGQPHMLFDHNWWEDLNNWPVIHRRFRKRQDRGRRKKCMC